MLVWIFYPVKYHCEIDSSIMFVRISRQPDMSWGVGVVGGLFHLSRTGEENGTFKEPRKIMAAEAVIVSAVRTPIGKFST